MPLFFTIFTDDFIRVRWGKEEQFSHEYNPDVCLGTERF